MKAFKRVISFILVLTLTVVGLPLTQIKVDAKEENYTQYSDLLYAYSDYLNDSEYLMNYIQDTQGAFDRVYMDYLESPNFWAMTAKESLLKAVNITEWLGIMGSALGVSDYVYENALDNANQLFAKHLLQSTSRTFTDTMGAGGDWAEKISKLHELFEYYEKWADSVNVSDAEKINESLTMLYNSQLLKCVSNSDIKSLQYFIIENESASQMISKAGNILKAGEALMVALVMEDMRIYAIDSIMRFSPQGALLDGMHRLKNQLKYGFVSYFAENFIKGELLTNIAVNVVECIAEYSMGSATPYTVVKLIVEVSVFVVFDCIFQVKSLDDFTTQRIITEYAYDCSSMILSANSVFKNYFTFEDVQAYQNLYTILRALTDASFEASREICLISNKGDLNFYQNMYAEDNIYARTMEDVKKIVDKIPVSERKRTVYTEWRIDDSAVLDFGSDILSENEFYCPDGVFCGNIFLAETKKITIPENSKFKIDGDLTLSRSLNSFVEGDAELTVDGELEIVGNIYERFGYSKIKNNGLLKLHKNLGTEIESCGDIIFCGTEKQYVGDSFVAENVYVENSAGIKFNSYDTIINGEFLLNGNPLDKEGYNVQVGSQRFTYDSISDYNDIEIPIDYEITKDIKANIYIKNLKTLTVPKEAKVKIDGLLQLSRSMHFEEEGYADLIVDGELEILGEQAAQFAYSKIKNYGILKLHKSLGSKIESYGDIIFCGTEKQYIRNSFEAENVYVENSEGIKFTGTNPIINGEFLLNGNPLDKEGKNIKVGSQRFTYDSISNYNTIEIPMDYVITKDITANIELSALKSLTIPSGGDVTVKGNVHLDGSNSSNTSTLVNNGNLQLVGNITCDFGAKLVNNGIFKLNGNLSCNLEGDGEYIFDGDKEQYIMPYKSSVSNFRKITLKNESKNGVIFGKKICVTELFNHNGNNFTLYERGNGSRFVDFDGDSLNDNNDPEPTVYDGVYYYGNSYGDVNTDKNINILDLVKINKAVLNNDTDSKYDINKDEGINSLDLSLLRRFIFTEYHILLKKYMN